MWVPLMFIVAAVVMIVGPIMMMQPNRLQRHQSCLRDYALRKGLKVQIRQIPRGAMSVDDRELLPVYTLPPDEGAEKRKRAEPWMLVKKKLIHEIHFSGHWDWYEKRKAGLKWHSALKQVLTALPHGVIAIGIGPQGAYAYWGEDGNEASVDALRLQLTVVNDQFK